MAVSEKFFIKVNSDNVYDTNGTFKSLKEIHTNNSIKFPQNDLSRYHHPVIAAMGSDPNAYRQVYSTDSTRFVNSSEGIDFPYDALSDAVKPIVSGKLNKGGTDYPMMNPYMVAVLDTFAHSINRANLGPGTYSMGRYGYNANLNNAGILELQGGGGGSGGTNYNGSDSAGGGGGGGGFAAIYYRFKNTSASCSMVVGIGDGGSAGGSDGATDGGGGGTTYVTFKTPNGDYTVYAYGGGGGETGDVSYTFGGAGGGVSFNGTSYAGGGNGGNSGQDPSSGGVYWGPKALVDDSYLCLYLLVAQGGAGGGRGDDTDGNPTGQGGAGTSAVSFTIPGTNGISCKTVTNTAKSGGGRGADVTDATAGGGGASTLNNGAGGAAKSTTGTAGSYGAGAGGAGCGDNSNRAGGKGGAGLVYYYV